MFMRLISRTNFRLSGYFGGTGAVISVLIILCFIAVMYSIKPGVIIDSYIVSGVFAFGLMVFVATNIGGRENTVQEQILFLLEKRWVDYYIARELSLIVITIVYCFLIALGPVYANIVNHFSFFTRALTVNDFISGFLLVFAGGLSGLTIGDLLNRRVMKNRKLSLTLTVMITILTIVYEGVCKEVPRLVVLRFLFPPVMLPAKEFIRKDIFEMGKVFAIVVYTMGYCLVLSSLKIVLMNRNRFE